MTTASSPLSRGGVAALGATPAPRVPQVSSTELLGDAKALTIEHEGMHYTLRVTRAGKLILTK